MKGLTKPVFLYADCTEAFTSPLKRDVSRRRTACAGGFAALLFFSWLIDLVLFLGAYPRLLEFSLSLRHRFSLTSGGLEIVLSFFINFCPGFPHSPDKLNAACKFSSRIPFLD